MKQEEEERLQLLKLEEATLEELAEQTNDSTEAKSDSPQLHEFEFTNRTYNIFEFYFNCAVCYIMLRDFEKAY